MDITTFKIPGGNAIRILTEYRSQYSETGQYPFLIGDEQDMERVTEAARFNPRDSAAIIQASFNIQIDDWIEKRRNEVRESGFSPDEMLSEWPGEVRQKESIGLHKDILSGKIKPEVYLGFARIDSPWHLPAFLKYGAWNECPAPEVHCEFHRYWQEKFGTEITVISGDVIECSVKTPPITREEATALAWEQYWYCNDIVDQGCDSVATLAATLLSSPYWYFWWD